MLKTILAAALLLPSPARASSRPPEGLEPSQFAPLLQAFVDREYLKAFRHLGDERDFDHGHVLYSPDGSRPVAILYHTQELAADEKAGSEYGFVDAGARNWIQWIDKGGIENASAYERRDYPGTAYWAWFAADRVPVYRKYGTIVDKMLDPERVGAETGKSRQVVFTRVGCEQAPAPEGREGLFSVKLPTGERVCLSLRAS